MWNCPECQRPFKNINQPHSCVRVDPETPFSGCPENIRVLFSLLMENIGSMGHFVTTATRHAIFLKNKSTFLALKPRKKRLDVEFFLPRSETGFPVSKSVQVSRNRVAHIVSVDETSQIDRQLLQWIAESYHLVNGTGSHKTGT